MAELRRELEAAKRAALVAGGRLSYHWHQRSFTVSSKAPGDPVTSADLEANRAIARILRPAFPDYGWLSEETADNPQRLERERVWIIDPLDGTNEFIQGVPEFCVSVALVERGEAVLGVIYNPIRRELYWGSRELGCFRGRQRVEVSRIPTLRRANILASRTEIKAGEWRIFEDALKTTAVGSVAYKLALIASCFGDGTFTRRPKSEWDVAAGTALITAAGGCVTTLDGEPLRFNRPQVTINGLVASNCLIHRQLLNFIASRTAAALSSAMTA